MCVLWQTGELTVECEWTLHSQAIAHWLRHDEAKILNDIMVRHMRQLTVSMEQLTVSMRRKWRRCFSLFAARLPAAATEFDNNFRMVESSQALRDATLATFRAMVVSHLIDGMNPSMFSEKKARRLLVRITPLEYALALGPAVGDCVSHKAAKPPQLYGRSNHTFSSLTSLAHVLGSCPPPSYNIAAQSTTNRYGAVGSNLLTHQELGNCMFLHTHTHTYTHTHIHTHTHTHTHTTHTQTYTHWYGPSNIMFNPPCNSDTGG